MSVCPSINQYTHVSNCPSVCSSLHMSVFPSYNTSICSTIYQSVFLHIRIRLFISPYVLPSVSQYHHLLISLTVNVSMFLSLCISIYLSANTFIICLLMFSTCLIFIQSKVSTLRRHAKLFVFFQFSCLHPMLKTFLYNSHFCVIS
jgi:hypothetical protein